MKKHLYASTRCYGYFLSVVVLSLIGCASIPASFISTYEPGWASIEIREGMKYEAAWQEVTDVLAKKFELEMISKDGGYLRTSWIYT